MLYHCSNKDTISEEALPFHLASWGRVLEWATTKGTKENMQVNMLLIAKKRISVCPYVKQRFVSNAHGLVFLSFVQKTSRYHGRKIGIFLSSGIVCKPSMVTPIKNVFSKILLNKDCNFGFCFDDIDHNKQRQHFVCNYDVAQHKVNYFENTFSTLSALTFMWNLIYIYWSKKWCLRFFFSCSIIFLWFLNLKKP